MKPVAEKHMRMAVGTVEETSILDVAKRENKINPSACAPTTSHCERISLGCTSSGIEVEVVGMCDALDKACVYEVKRRKAKLFHTVPEYERIQLESYLRMYNRLDGALVEYHPDEGLGVHWVEQDDSLWEAVEVAVVNALEEMD